MRRTLRLLIVLSIVTAPSASTQAQTPRQAPPALDTVAAGLKQLYQAIRYNIVEAAKLMPEADYAFRPTPDVRTFGQLVGHVTNTHYNFCTAARGVKNPAAKNYETLTTKADLVAALEASVAFCDAAYDPLADADVGASATFGPVKITKGYALVYNIAHDNEHYGNMVTYLRMKGLVPPSSARRGRGGDRGPRDE
jgi:uncharacterized damage-inducible protein DinB